MGAKEKRTGYAAVGRKTEPKEVTKYQETQRKKWK